MDLQQAVNTIKWMDEERRKDRAELTALQDRLVDLESRLALQQTRDQQLESNLTTVASSLQRFSRIDEALDKIRADVSRQIETIEGRRANSEREAEKLRIMERESVNKSLVELRKGLEPIPQLQKEGPARREEENRLSRELRELEVKLGDLLKLDEERARSQSLLEEGRRQDARRLADLQGTIPPLYKKVDELKPKIESLEDPIRRMEARVNEVAQAEAERRTQQIAFIEHQAVVNAERERLWTEWQPRLDALHAEAEDFYRRMDSYAEKHREMKKELGAFQPVIERLERRINEAGEMQRLSEDRFRQEWVAFQADEQKRWTTHMLMRDEQWRENDRQFHKLFDRIAAVEEQAIEFHELVRDMPDTDYRRLQSLLTLVREWVAEHEHAFTQVR